jgi:DNA polymerase
MEICGEDTTLVEIRKVANSDNVSIWRNGKEAAPKEIFESVDLARAKIFKDYANAERLVSSGDAVLEAYLTRSDKSGLRFKGVNQFTKKWGWIWTHGGKIIENCTQGLARDVFKHGQLLAEENDYPVILPVHDELVCEVPDTEEYTVHGLEEMMATVPVWAPGLPLAAEGFEDYVYHK